MRFPPSERSTSAGARKVAGLFLVSLSVLALGGCRWLLAGSGPTPIVVRSESIELSWDATQPTTLGLSPAVDHYRVYYRTYATLEWVYLKPTSANETTTTITRPDLDVGSYEFAVQEVYGDGTRSAIHGSSDFTAWPPGGWYLVWHEP